MSAPEPVVTVTAHAVERYRLRYRKPDADLFETAREIDREVRRAIKGGRVSNHKLKNFMLYREKRKELPPGQRFVYTEDKRTAWVIKEDNGTIVVVTTLSPTIAVAA